MGNRLSQIATRTGDDGTTGLGDGARVPKNHLRIAAMGEVDELNSHIGVLLCEALPERAREQLVDIQHQLFNLGGELSIPGYELLKEEAVAALDAALAEHNATLPAWPSSSSRQARARPRWRMYAARLRGAPSAPSSRSARPKRCARPRATTSTACRT